VPQEHVALERPRDQDGVEPSVFGGDEREVRGHLVCPEAQNRTFHEQLTPTWRRQLSLLCNPDTHRPARGMVAAPRNLVLSPRSLRGLSGVVFRPLEMHRRIRKEAYNRRKAPPGAATEVQRVCAVDGEEHAGGRPLGGNAAAVVAGGSECAHREWRHLSTRMHTYFLTYIHADTYLEVHLIHTYLLNVSILKSFLTRI
jgi:hypothetical protein